MELLLNPNVAYVLLLIGAMLGLMALVTPGTGLLEIGALACLAVAGYAVTQLDFNWWALVVMFLGVVPFVYAIQKPRRELFLAISILALVIGSVYLFRDANGGPAVNVFVALAASLLFAGFLWIAIRKTLQALHEVPTHDLNLLVGQFGEARTAVHVSGSVQVAGELWSARSDGHIPAGGHVKVIGRDGFTLIVEAEAVKMN